jgi:serine protease AprX
VGRTPPATGSGSLAARRRSRSRWSTPPRGTAANLASFVATVTDAAGRVVGTTTTNTLYATGVAHALVTKVRPGRYTVNVSGEYAVSDPDTLDSDSVNGRVVFLQAAQLQRR